MIDEEEKKSLLCNEGSAEDDDTTFLELNCEKQECIPCPSDDHVETAVEQSDDEIGSEKETENLTTVNETFWNICNSIQGLPILTIPFTFRSGGWWSLGTVIVISLASLYTSQVLVKSLYETKNGIKIRVRSSYMDIGEAFWNYGGRRLVIFIMVTELLFVSTMYPILVGNLFTKSFPGAHIPAWGWTLIGGIVMLPNAVLKNLSQVAWTSIITVMCSFIIFATVLAFSFTKTKIWKFDNMNNFNVQEFPGAVAIIVSCYLAQPFVPYIESTMKNPDRYIPTLNWSFLSMTLLNIAIGIFATLTFYPNIEEVITSNLPAGAFRLIINAMSVILALTSYTLPMFTSFEVLETSDLCCFKNVKYKEAIRLLLVILTVVMAAFIPHFQYLLAFVGSLTGIALEFIFPPLFHMRIYFLDLEWWELVLDMIVVFLGSLCLAISFIVSWISMHHCYAHGVCH